VWLVHGDGGMVSLTYEPDQKVIAAALHRVGTDVVVEDVVSVVNPDNKLQELWFLATYGSSTYVCYMAAPYRPTLPRKGATVRQRMAALDQAHYVDVGLRLDSPKLITGFTKANPVVITCHPPPCPAGAGGIGHAGRDDRQRDDGHLRAGWRGRDRLG